MSDGSIFLLNASKNGVTGAKQRHVCYIYASEDTLVMSMLIPPKSQKLSNFNRESTVLSAHFSQHIIIIHAISHFGA